MLPILLAACSSSSSDSGIRDASQSRGDVVLYLSEDFENKSFSTLLNNSVINLDHYPDPIQPFVDFPGKGIVLHYHFPVGRNDTTPAQIGVSGDEAFLTLTGSRALQEMYLEWDEYFPDSHDFANGSQKIFRAGFWGKPNPHELSEQEGRIQIGLELMWENSYFDLTSYYPATNNSRERSRSNHQGFNAPRNQWFTLAVWIQLNTPGKSDGRITVYRDDKIIAEIHDADLRGDNTEGVNYFWIGGNYSNLGQVTRQSSSRYIDNIRWYSSKP
ncbi:MAG TPA: hypothetical protein PKA63_00110 [Oligoflexia bacterium]|nr:hypothetical protein [Oligoflexia bacterium]HMP47051.1 hypothetical protein [Oligoflexia bacterium]